MTFIPKRGQSAAVYCGAFAAVSLIALTTPAHGDVTFSPAADIRQVFNHTSNQDRGWLEVGAGFDLKLDTNRVDGNVSYRYAHRFEEFGRIDTKNRHNGNANIHAELIEDFLTLDAGGSASQFATDVRGFSALNNDSDNGNQTQVFSGYVQPTIRQRLGDLANFEAHYRIGAVSADGPRENAQLSDQIGLDPRDGLGSLLSDSVTHSGGVTVESTRGTNTINWKLFGDGTREDVDQLNQEYRGYRAGGEVGVQVSREFELLGSGGYEDILNTQDSIKFNAVTGLPELNPDGSFMIDPLNPRRTAFDFSGEFWNVGFRYTPSRRTRLELRGGERYGSLNLFGDFSFQTRSGMVINANFQQTLNSFSRLLTQSQNGVARSIRRVSGISQFGVPFCILGVDPRSPGGECLLGLTQSITPATFRSDMGTISVSRRMEKLSWSAALFYDKRRYVDVQQLQSPSQPQLQAGLVGNDQTYGVRGNVSLNLNENETLRFDTLLAHNDFALSQDRREKMILLGTHYTRQLNKRLHGTASLYGTKRFVENRRDDHSISAAVGLEYRF